MANWNLPTEVMSSITQMVCLLHATNAWRLQPLLVGMLFARGRLAVSSWLRAGELSDDFQSYYYFLGSLGREVHSLAALLLMSVLRMVNPDQRILFAIDDTPAKRHGPRVEGAGIHHNPTPGPADQKHLYGHVWPRTATCGHVRPRAATCGHVRPRVATCGHVRPRVATCGRRYLWWCDTRSGARSGCRCWPICMCGKWTWGAFRRTPR